jgi:hypothetical protein
MAFWTLGEVEQFVRESWGVDTCDPAGAADWHPGNPSREQCGVTALVLHDLFGGELICADVHVEGERVGYHWWNRFGAGVEVDLTRDQFRPEEIVLAGRSIERPPGPPGRCREQYELLRSRVLARLGA